MIVLTSFENITPVPNQKAKDFEESFDLNDPYNFFFWKIFFPVSWISTLNMKLIR